MGPFVLFDKSFLQSISVDESVWFDNFFTAIVCPLFYVETLADLKKTKVRTTPEEEVEKIAIKFPEISGSPCAFHSLLCINDLLGNHVPMRNQIPRSQGRLVKVGDKSGVVYDHSEEAKAFLRWAEGKFLEIEQNHAEQWRKDVQNLDLEKASNILREKGINAKSCKTLVDAKNNAETIISNTDKSTKILQYACEILKIPTSFHSQILSRWTSIGCPPINRFAPYVAYVLRVQLFFQIACAANLISTARPSNLVDISYLFYLPFCQIFVSADKLHQKCVPLFIREDQEFIWGKDLKKDLGKLNEHYVTLPIETREKGLNFFAKSPPSDEKFLVTRLWNKYGWNSRKQFSENDLKIAPSIVEEMIEIADAPQLHTDAVDFDPKDADTITIKRMIKKKKGAWYQLPMDLKDKPK